MKEETLNIDDLKLKFRVKLPEKMGELKALSELCPVSSMSIEQIMAIHRIAHELSGSSATFGYKNIGDCARKLASFILPYLSEDKDLVNMSQAEFDQIIRNLLRLSHHLTETAEVPLTLSEGQKRPAKNRAKCIFVVDLGPNFLSAINEIEDIETLKIVRCNGEEDILLKLTKYTPELIIIDFSDQLLLPTLEKIAKYKFDNDQDFSVTCITADISFKRRVAAAKLGVECILHKNTSVEKLISTVKSKTMLDVNDSFRVMVIDDDSNLLEFYQKALSSAGINVKATSDAKKTIDLIDSFRPDVIVLDYQMPEISGIDLASVIRQSPDYDLIPIIFLSAESRFSYQKLLKNQIGDDFLVKPIDPIHLFETVERHARRSRKNSELNTAYLATLNELEQEKLKAQNMAVQKSEFLAQMSHEIRTPLNSILASVQLMDQLEVSEEVADLTHIQKTSGNHLLNIVNQILDLSKIDAGKIDLEVFRFSIADICRNLVEIFGRQAEEKGIFFATSFSPMVPKWIASDRTRINQIVINLVGNAIKFTEEGSVLVHIGYEENRLSMKVSDTGIGVEEAHLPKIFADYSQADSSTTRKFGGTGLGLPISQKLAALLGGEIRVNSAKGKGSDFILEIPVTESESSNFRDFLEIGHLFSLKILTKNSEVKKYFKIVASQFGLPLRIFSCEDHFKNAKYACSRVTELSIIDSYWSDISWDKLINGANNHLNPDLTVTIGSHSTFNYPSLKPSLHQLNLASILLATVGPAFSKKVSQMRNDVANLPNTLVPNVLVADDNQANQEIMIRILKKLGCRVQIAKNGQEAFKKYKMVRFHIIFMDAQMPVMDGLEATEVIRAYEVERNLLPTPIMALTAQSHEAEIEKCLNAGMDGHLSKPVNVSLIRTMILKYVFGQIVNVDTGLKSLDSEYSVNFYKNFQKYLQSSRKRETG